MVHYGRNVLAVINSNPPYCPVRKVDLERLPMGQNLDSRTYVGTMSIGDKKYSSSDKSKSLDILVFVARGKTHDM
jgi:hypothetical protein